MKVNDYWTRVGIAMMLASLLVGQFVIFGILIGEDTWAAKPLMVVAAGLYLIGSILWLLLHDNGGHVQKV